MPVADHNMIEDPTPSPDRFSTVGVYGADESAIFSKKITNPPLREGTNWVAVEVHQADSTSSDTSFDLEFRQHTHLPPATFSVSGSANIDGLTIEAQWAPVSGATSYRLYRRNLIAKNPVWTHVETFTGTSGAYTPLMGHASPETTAGYVHVSSARIAAEYAKAMNR